MPPRPPIILTVAAASRSHSTPRPPHPHTPHPHPHPRAWQRRFDFWKSNHLRRALLKFSAAFSTPTVFNREGKWGTLDEVLAASNNNHASLLPGYFELLAYTWNKPVSGAVVTAMVGGWGVD